MSFPATVLVFMFISLIPILIREAAMGKDKALRAIERTHQTAVVGSSLTRLGLQSIVLCVTRNRRY